MHCPPLPLSRLCWIFPVVYDGNCLALCGSKRYSLHANTIRYRFQTRSTDKERVGFSKYNITLYEIIRRVKLLKTLSFKQLTRKKQIDALESRKLVAVICTSPNVSPSSLIICLPHLFPKRDTTVSFALY